MQRREEMLPAEPKIEAFLSDLAVKGWVAAGTQNQAFNAEPRTLNSELRNSGIPGFLISKFNPEGGLGPPDFRL